MSVKVSRREEKRDTSLRDFILVATLPLLLCGLIGFFIGQAGKIDAGVTGDDLTSLTLRAEKAETINKEILWLGNYADSLLQIIVDNEKENSAKWLSAISAPPSPGSVFNPITDWTASVSKAHSSLSTEIAKLKGQTQGNNILNSNQISYFIHPLELLNNKIRDAFYEKKNSYSSGDLSQKEMAKILEEQREELEGDKEELQKQLNAKDLTINFKDQRIALLETNVSGGPPPPPPSFADQKRTMKGALIEIAGAIESIPDGILANKSKRRELETNINLQINIIDAEVSKLPD